MVCYEFFIEKVAEFPRLLNRCRSGNYVNSVVDAFIAAREKVLQKLDIRS
jgi:hypothetical protein